MMLAHGRSLSLLLATAATTASLLPAQTPAVLTVRDVTLGGPPMNVRFDLVPGHRASFTTTGDPGEATVFLVSATMPGTPVFIGGVPLAIDPANFAAIAPSFVNTQGVTSFGFRIPYNFTVGTRLCTQTLLVDPNTLGLRLSNGVVLRVGGEPFRNLSIGSQSGHPLGQTPQGGAVLVADAEAWTRFWQLHRSIVFPQPSPPEVDFRRDAVVAVFAGSRPTGGHSLVIEQVRQVSKSGQVGLRVEGQQTSPGVGCFVFQVITQPFHIVTIPRAAVNGGIVDLVVPNKVVRCQ